MGGAVTNLAAIKLGLRDLRPRRRPRHAPDPADVEHADRALEPPRPPTERRQIVGLQPARAEVILAGACIVRTVLDVLGTDALAVSDRALRHGLIVDRFEP